MLSSITGGWEKSREVTHDSEGIKGTVGPTECIMNSIRKCVQKVLRKLHLRIPPLAHGRPQHLVYLTHIASPFCGQHPVQAFEDGGQQQALQDG